MPRLTLISEQVLARVPGGTGRYSQEVSAAVGAAAPPGWQVGSVTAWHRVVGAARVPGVGGPVRLPVGPRVLARLWERGLPPSLRGSVVHALTPLAPARLRPGQSLVVTVHDAVPYNDPATLTPRGAVWHRLMIERAMRIAAAVVVPTEAVATELRAAGLGAGVRIEVIGEGVPVALSRPISAADAARVRVTLGLPDRYLVIVGTLEPRKGLDVLLDALARGAAPGMTLAVVGQPGWGGLDLAREAADRGLADRVLGLGRLPDDQLAAVLDGAALSVTPSRSEGFGLPLLEAMSRGVPVIHSTAPALVEVAAGAGFCFPTGDAGALATALDAVLGDPETAARMSTAGRLRAIEYSWETVALQLWTLYEDVTRPVTGRR